MGIVCGDWEGDIEMEVRCGGRCLQVASLHSRLLSATSSQDLSTLFQRDTKSGPKGGWSPKMYESLIESSLGHSVLRVPVLFL